MARKKAARRGKKRASARKKRRGSLLGGLLRYLLRLGIKLTVLGGLLLGGVTAYFAATLPEVDDLLDGRKDGSVTLLDKNGDVFAWRGAQFGGAVRAGEVSPYLINAILAAEDRRFYQHFGVDPRGLLRAMWANYRAGAWVQGGSTITQQVAKNVFLTSDRSFERKLKEIPVALALEWKYTKDEILSIYINRVYLGAGTNGFEAAAQRYFGVSARTLNAPQAAMLAGLLKAPSRFAPTSDLRRAQGRAGIVVDAMVEEGYLSPAEGAKAKAEPARLSAAAASKTGRYFADWVMESTPKWLTESTEDVVIRTTFDPAAQAAADHAVASVFAQFVKKGSTAQAAVVLMSPDGAVRAMVGGRDYATSQFNRATQAKRQPGSAFKPIVYAAAFEAGMTPSTVMEDSPVSIEGWKPRNWNHRYSGSVTLVEALARSINSVAVKTSEAAGRERVRAMAVRLGLTTEIAEGPSVALGVSETTLLDLTGVYAVFANGGLEAHPYGITEIRVRNAPDALMSRDVSGRQRILSRRNAGWLTGMLAETIAWGTGRRAALHGRAAAGKTGTSQSARDAWFIGYTADYVAGVWMGKDDNAGLTGVAGGGLPAAIWREMMEAAHKGLPPRPLLTAPYDPTPQPGPSSSARGTSVVGAVLRDVISILTGRSDNDDPSASRRLPQAGNDR